jgi:hypothetical protein
MERRGEEFMNWTPNFVGTQQPDFDGFYRHRTVEIDDERPRNRGGFEPVAVPTSRRRIYELDPKLRGHPATGFRSAIQRLKLI